MDDYSLVLEFLTAEPFSDTMSLKVLGNDSVLIQSQNNRSSAENFIKDSSQESIVRLRKTT